MELCRCLRVQRRGALKISSLRVKNRDRYLNDSLVEKFLGPLAALPDLFPRLVTFEEFSFVEEIDPLLEKMRERLPRCVAFGNRGDRDPSLADSLRMKIPRAEFSV
jgi:hypothetical protein